VALAGVDVARQPEEIALLWSTGRQRSRMAEERRKPAGTRVAGRGDGRTERLVVEVPVDTGRTADAPFQLIRVSRGDRPALPASRKELPHR
jgi:hypothetical protein